MTESIPVTVDQFKRAETDRYMATTGDTVGTGVLVHQRNLVDIDKQDVIRMNRDTIYSYVTIDLEAGPVTLTLPESGTRFMSLQVIDQDHYTVGVWYDAEPHTFTREQIGTRYLIVLIRTLISPSVPGDLDDVHALQDAVRVEQAAKGSFEVPAWNQADLDEIREALLVLAKHQISFVRAFGSREEVDPIKHLIGTAAGWGGNPDKDATYVALRPTEEASATSWSVRLADVPVDGFWSISVYNEAGFFEKNAQDRYTLNNLTANADADGSVTVHFAATDDGSANWLPTTPGWNGLLRLYRPRPEILDGSWQVPAVSART